MLERAKEHFVGARNFLHNAKKENAVNNLRTLQISCTATVVLLIFFLLAAPLIIKDWKPSPQHIAFLPAILCFRIIVEIYAKKGGASPKAVNALCVLFQVTVFLFVVLIDAASDKTAPASFVPLVSVVFPICFIMPFWVSYSIVAFFDLVYTVLISLLKTDRNIVQHDIFRVMSALLFSIVIERIVTSLRVQEYERRIKYELLSEREPLLPEIYNKQGCQKLITAYLGKTAPSVSAALVILDLDNFKTINDTYGHYTGDLILRRVGTALKSSFDGDDIIARFGGDEFIAFIPKHITEDELRERCRLVSAAVDGFNSGGQTVKVTCSIGGLLVDGQDVDDYNVLFCQADDALYEAKRNGKNRLVVRRYDSTGETPHIPEGSGR